MTQSPTASKKQKKPVFGFVTGKPLWVNILVGVVLSIIILLIFLQSLDWMTMHGKTLTIPSVMGKSYTEAVKVLEDQGFDVMIQDSIYNDTAAPLLVLRQFPEADATVKRNRTVYLTINRAIPPLIEMPNLEGLSFRSAEVAITQYGLNLADTVYRNHFARNAVLEQQLDGERIKPGTKVHMGSEIVLVLGSGVGEEQFPVPDLFGRTLSEARVYLESMGLMIDVISPPELGSNPNAFVYDQEPKPFTADGRINTIRQGQLVDLFLKIEKPLRDTASKTPANDY
jgi:eukaryotic-like serine/threonine-protein kinase